jgi:hypothetical protein
MNRNLKQSLWVLALGMAFTGFSRTSRAAALPAQQGQDQDRNQNRDRNDNQKEDRVYFQQGVQDGQHDRQFGSNRSDHPQPTDAKDLRAYRDGYKQGIRNAASELKAPGRVRRIWWTRRT